jgi:hypothetical protein
MALAAKAMRSKLVRLLTRGGRTTSFKNFDRASFSELLTLGHYQHRPKLLEIIDRAPLFTIDAYKSRIRPQ